MNESEITKILKENFVEEFSSPEPIIRDKISSSEFPLKSLKRGAVEGVKPDIFGFGRIGTEKLELGAVECKKKNSAMSSFYGALGQAIRYTKYCHFVYIATQKGELGEFEKNLLEDYGIGHYYVDLEGKEFNKNLEAEKREPIILSNGFSENMLQTYLSFKEIFGDYEIMAGAKIIRSPPKGEEPHVSAGPRENENTVYIQTNISRVPQVRNFYKIDYEEFSEFLEDLPNSDKIYLKVSERKKINIGAKRGDVKFSNPPFGWERVNNVTPEDFEEIEEKCKKMKGNQGSDLARIRFRRKFLVENSESIKRKLEKAWREIEPIHNFLED